MTVSELIEKLKELPGEAVVVYCDHEDDVRGCELFEATIEPAATPGVRYVARDYSRSAQGRNIIKRGTVAVL
jgi:hypothetical protein